MVNYFRGIRNVDKKQKRGEARTLECRFDSYHHADKPGARKLYWLTREGLRITSPGFSELSQKFHKKSFLFLAQRATAVQVRATGPLSVCVLYKSARTVPCGAHLVVSQARSITHEPVPLSK